MKMRYLGMSPPATAKGLVWLFLTGLATLNVHAAAHFELLKKFGGGQILIGQEHNGSLHGSTGSGGEVFRFPKDGSGDPVFLNIVPRGYYGIADRPLVGTDGSIYEPVSLGALAGGDGPYAQGGVFKLNAQLSSNTLLAGLGTNGVDHFNPTSLFEGSDGILYGTAYNSIPGIGSFVGTVFKLNEDGSDYRTLYMFGTNDTGPEIPTQLMAGRDGILYGTTDVLIFKLANDGRDFAVLLDLSQLGSETVWSLIEGSDDSLYGTTESVAFAINKDGSQFRILHTFASNDGSAGFPRSLVEGNDGALYGVTVHDETNGFGTVFGLSKDGTSYHILHSFVGDAGGGFIDYNGYPTGLMKGEDGLFYGGTTIGPCICEGDSPIVFKLWPEQTPDLITMDTATKSRLVSVEGVGGFQYQILVSRNLATWSALTNFLMPSTGRFTYSDNAGSNSAAFYRAAWIP